MLSFKALKLPQVALIRQVCAALFGVRGAVSVALHLRYMAPSAVKGECVYELTLSGCSRCASAEAPLSPCPPGGRGPGRGLRARFRLPAPGLRPPLGRRGGGFPGTSWWACEDCSRAGRLACHFRLTLQRYNRQTPTCRLPYHKLQKSTVTAPAPSRAPPPQSSPIPSRLPHANALCSSVSAR